MEEQNSRPRRLYTKKARRRRKRMRLQAVAAGLCAAVLTLGVARIPAWLESRRLQNSKPSSGTQPVSVQPETPAGPQSSVPDTSPRMDFTELRRQNKDVVGWICLPGVGIDLPVMQAQDNQTYLRHGLDGEYDELGLPFADYECDLKNGQHTILYGHNMGPGRSERFSPLHNYWDPEFCREHPVIQLDTLYESCTYKIAAVFVLTSRPEDPDYFAFNEYVDFADEAQAQAYLDEVERRALYTVGELCPDERLLSLCTCTHEIADLRLVILARPLRAGEDETCGPIRENPDPVMPSRWPADW